MHRLWLVFLIGCFPPRFPEATKTMPELAWASGDRSTYAYLDNGALTIVRPDGGKLVMTRGKGCYDRPDRVYFTHDGREVYVLAWYGQSARTACRIDTTSGASFPVPPASVADAKQNNHWVIGGFTGWIYRLQATQQDAVDRVPANHSGNVIDHVGQRTGTLPIRTESSACDLIETPQRVLIACLQAPSVEISELDTTQFPPALIRTRKVDVSGPSLMRFSRDGKFLVVWDQPVLNVHAMARVFDLDGMFQVAQIRSRFPIAGIDLRGTELAVLEEPRYGQGELVITTFQGLERQHYPFQAVTSDIYWLADGRLLATGFDGSAVFRP